MKLLEWQLKGVRLFERMAVGPVAANLHLVSRCREGTQESCDGSAWVSVSG